MKAEQYRPNYFTGFKQEKNIFTNVEELLNIEWIKKFSKDTDFHRYSLVVDNNWKGIIKRPQHTLIAEYNKGYKWLVVCFIRDENIEGIINELPEWKAKYKQKIT